MSREKNLFQISLGSRLAIFNMLCFVMMIGVSRWSEIIQSSISFLLIPIILILSFPLVLPLMIPQLDYFPPYGEVIMVPLVIVLNACVWGYGIAYLWNSVHQTGRRRSKRIRAVKRKTLTANY